jgi:AcrR family transcriptional regulator
MSSTTGPARISDAEAAARVRRGPLSRSLVLSAALTFVDVHGLAELSMRKLGARLGVEAMSLYSYVRSKEDMLDGIVELLWAEVEAAVEPTDDWPDTVRSMANSMRSAVHRHPTAAPLLVSRNLLPAPALRVFAVQLDRIRRGGRSAERSAEAVRTVVAYALGYATTETDCLSATSAGGPCAARVGADGVAGTELPAELADVAAMMAQCDLDVQFRSGLELIIKGMRAASHR